MIHRTKRVVRDDPGRLITHVIEEEFTALERAVAVALEAVRDELEVCQPRDVDQPVIRVGVPHGTDLHGFTRRFLAEAKRSDPLPGGWRVATFQFVPQPPPPAPPRSMRGAKGLGGRIL